MALLGNLTGSSQFFNDPAFYNDVATQSLRFDRGSSAYLSRTPSSSGNRQVWTVSFWIKRTDLSVSGGIASTYGSSTVNTQWDFTTDDTFRFYDYHSSYQWQIITNRVFRDTSSWYHIVLAVDTTQGTASNRIKIYVNGVQETSFSTEDYPSQNLNTADWNTNTAHYIGKHSTIYVGAYLAEFNNIDGTQLTPSSFGETKNGVWIPIEYTGSYGTNGFRLQFDQVGVGTASTSTIGADTSGNTHHFTSTNIAASDCAMPDSPENNWCTLNPLNKDSVMTLSEGNLKTGGGNGEGGSTFGVSSGKWYWELRLVDPYASIYWGLHGVHNVITESVYSGGAGFYALNASGGGLYANGSLVTAKASGWATGDIIGLAYDADNLTLGVYQNNSQIGSNLTVPDAFNFPVYFQNASGGDTSSVLYNFGQDDTFAGAISATGNTDGNGIGVFKYAPPSGFLALCTANLPEPTIGPNSLTQADDHFNTVLISTGTDSETAITGVGFQPDFTWGKSRNSAYSHQLYDSSRGATKYLESDDTAAEATDANSLKSFDSDGITIGTGSTFSPYSNGNNVVFWNWKANGGTTSSNTDGSITSTVQANTDAGFSIVTYVGTGANATVGHGLSKAPDFMVAKSRSATGNWYSYQGDGTKTMLLNNSAVEFATGDKWNNTDTTATVFSLGTEVNINGDGNNHIAYCFHSVEGYSKIGSYIGNASADGTFVYTGFRPAWVIVKAATGAVQHWWMFDNKREGYNGDNDQIYANLSSAEGTSDVLDLVSNGFKLITSSAVANGSGVTYIYMAFAETPTKYSLAR